MSVLNEPVRYLYKEGDSVELRFTPPDLPERRTTGTIVKCVSHTIFEVSYFDENHHLRVARFSESELPPNCIVGCKFYIYRPHNGPCEMAPIPF